jgi:hypothetical protein
MTDLVIAYYNEKDDLDIFINYANKYNYNLKLYNKGKNNPILKNINVNYEIKNLKNIGQATHTYLHHIIENYDKLNEITIFMLGSAFRRPKKSDKAYWLLNNANKCNGFMAKHIWLSDKSDFDFELPYYSIIDYNDINKKKRIKTKMIRANKLPLGNWISKNMNFNLEEKQFYRTNKCMFAVSKKLILKKSLSYYQNLIKQLTFSKRNLEVIHFFERAWVCVFLEPNKDKEYYEKNLCFDKEKYHYL